MNREEAKYLLRAYRLSGQDAKDRRFREALEMLKHDPELARWFDLEQGLDRKLAEKIGSFPVPPDLKFKLLASHKITERRRWWQKPSWLAAAAASVALVVTLVTLAIRSPGKAQFVDFRSYVGAVAADKHPRLDLMSEDLSAVRQWLERRKAPADFVIPAGLNGLPSLGCCVLDWNGRKVSFVCFEMENKQMVHLFVMDRDYTRGVPRGSVREVATLGNGVTTVSWIAGERVYVLAGHQTEQELRRLL